MPSYHFPHLKECYMRYVCNYLYCGAYVFLGNVSLAVCFLSLTW